MPFVQYAVEMANLLRQCLKEPYRTQLMNRNQMHFKEALWKDGQVLSKETFTQVKQAFEKGEEAAARRAK